MACLNRILRGIHLIVGLTVERCSLKGDKGCWYFYQLRIAQNGMVGGVRHSAARQACRISPEALWWSRRR